MNNVVLEGVLKNIKYSHSIQGTDFDGAQLLVKNSKGQEDIINLKFKSYTNKHQENDTVCLQGNLRSYSYRVDEGKNRVQLYVFTYFDHPDVIEATNQVHIDGRICKINELRNAKNKTRNIHFILANNIIADASSKRLNSYIPCIAWGPVADKVSTMNVNSKVKISGVIHSREHSAKTATGEVELRLVHELVVTDIEEV